MNLVDHCSPNPCQNRGSCISNTNGYKCICLAGYYGTRCQSGKFFIVTNLGQLLRLANGFPNFLEHIQIIVVQILVNMANVCGSKTAIDANVIKDTTV